LASAALVRQFVDREELIALFQAALREPRRTKPLVLVYHGGAGIGKSCLRRELMRLVDSRQQTADRAVVTATLDFDIPIYRQPDAALLSLRNALHEAYQAGFPSFDLAYAVHWQKTHPDTPLGDMTGIAAIPDRVPGSHVHDEVQPLLEPGSLLSQVLDESGKLPVIGLVPKIATLLRDQGIEGSRDRVKETPTSNLLPSTYYLDWWQRRGERELEDLPQMEPGAIVSRLPKLWAADLKDCLRQGSRESGVGSRRTSNDSPLFTLDSRPAVLFIDVYEQLWETGSSEADFFKRDEWVRELVKQLPEALWVICGREKLRWEEVDKDWSTSLSQHLVEALADPAARQLLASCEITDGRIQDAIIKGSQGVPHYLNLAVDTFQEIKQAGQRVPVEAESASTPEELFAQFIRHLDQPEIETLQILSASRFWHYGLFEHLVTEYQTGYPLTAYDDLNRFSFIGEGAAPETRTMHELMREALQENQPPELRKRVHLFLHELYAKQLEGLDVKNITEKHRAALTEAFYHGRQAKSAEELWSWLKLTHVVLTQALQYRLLTPLYREMVQALETELGPNHPDVATALHTLADELTYQGEYDEAEPLFDRALAIREKLLGPEHPDIEKTLHCFSHLRLVQARYADAESLLRRSHAMMEKRVGADHYGAACILSNLAAVLDSLGRYDEAEPLLRRSLSTMEKTVGPEHRNVARTLYALARVLQKQSKYLEAEALFRRALANAEKALGPEHPDVASIQSDFANLLMVEDKWAEAETLARRSSAIKEKALGSQHPRLAISLDILARLLNDRGEHAEADVLFRRALAIRENAFGPDHTFVAETLEGLAKVCEQTGRTAEAQELTTRAKRIRAQAESVPANPQKQA
jgi:tetratricopeptide (TPR) repeat protein